MASCDTVLLHDAFCDANRRSYNEDRVIAKVPWREQPHPWDTPEAVILAVDGHGGAQAADFCVENWETCLTGSLECVYREKRLSGEREWAEAARQTLQRLHEDYIASAVDTPRRRSGACVALLIVLKDFFVHAHVGDCRVTLIHGVKVVQLTRDHRPDSPTEQRRVEACVVECSKYRIPVRFVL